MTTTVTFEKATGGKEKNIHYFIFGSFVTRCKKLIHECLSFGGITLYCLLYNYMTQAPSTCACEFNNNYGSRQKSNQTDRAKIVNICPELSERLALFRLTCNYLN